MDANSLKVRRFAVSAFLMNNTNKGFSYRLELSVIPALDHQDARARFGLQCKDKHPAFGLQEILAVEVVDEKYF